VRADTTKKPREEHEMYGLTENTLLRQHEENGREVAVERPGKTTVEDRETRPYVVRELSWELARYLDTQDS
jgi:hypothetical protein